MFVCQVAKLQMVKARLMEKTEEAQIAKTKTLVFHTWRRNPYVQREPCLVERSLEAPKVVDVTPRMI
ncbi:hypothetical protein COCHEDRAFT_1018873 [Bipolaris maydis C5]|uniref:Uncharacterized protein n=1 Tax=Cochliobolus heterostrophus (strain C5 / ATCC 48332 / race O) TaxID=701091 RepID=M2TIW5_COCH5|nr:hypothetical protein COCHEDRAFT_1018873 [Bipolaris maydis C5]